jgi:hypothetical protein
MDTTLIFLQIFFGWRAAEYCFEDSRNGDIPIFYDNAKDSPVKCPKEPQAFHPFLCTKNG